MAQARVAKDQAQPVMVQERKPIEYPYVSLKPMQRPFHFSNKEIGHLALATILVVGVGLSLFFASTTNGDYLLIALSIAAFTASFLLHEIAHKIVAQKHGLWAEFRLTLMGAILTLFSIFLPLVKFISPGAVMVAGGADRKTMGKTAVAGPATNIVLATIFSVATAVLPSHALDFAVIAFFNAWIAVFNLIPFGIFDGLKVFVWDKRVWVLTFAASAVLMTYLAIVLFSPIS
jgi:Zn-dependent protease